MSYLKPGLVIPGNSLREYIPGSGCYCFPATVAALFGVTEREGEDITYLGIQDRKSVAPALAEEMLSALRERSAAILEKTGAPRAPIVSGVAVEDVLHTLNREAAKRGVEFTAMTRYDLQQGMRTRSVTVPVPGILGMMRPKRFTQVVSAQHFIEHAVRRTRGKWAIVVPGHVFAAEGSLVMDIYRHEQTSPRTPQWYADGRSVEWPVLSVYYLGPRADLTPIPCERGSLEHRRRERVLAAAQHQWLHDTLHPVR